MRTSGARLRPAAVPVAAAIVFALGLAACSGGSKGGTAGQAKGSATTKVTDAQTVDTNFSGAGGGEYCRLSRDYAESAKKFNAPTSAADLRQVFAEASNDIKAALAVAPAEIKPDVQTVANGLNAIIASMEAANYDVTRLAITPPSLPANFDTASARLDAYARNVCGLTG